MKQTTESEELKKDWATIQNMLPVLSLSPRALIYIAIGWASVTLFFVWMPLFIAYAGCLILWNIGRLCSGAVLKAGETLRGAPVPPSSTNHMAKDEPESPAK